VRLTQEEIRRIRSWKEGERSPVDTSRPRKPGDDEPMLPRVCFAIVSRHAHQRKTTCGKLKAAAKAIRLVLEVLEAGH
jgi:hypothetical protein